LYNYILHVRRIYLRIDNNIIIGVGVRHIMTIIYNAIDTDYYYLTAGNDDFRKRAGLMRFPAPDRLNIDVKIIWI